MTTMTDLGELDEQQFLLRADPEAAAILPALPALDPELGIDGLRKLTTQALDDLGALPMPVGVSRFLGAFRTFTPARLQHSDTAILWIHGGGLIGGEPRQDDLLCADLALTHGVPVLACSYRVAPEHPYPAGLDDCVTSLQAVVAEHDRVIIAGASAGGGLAIATAMRARDAGIHGVLGVVAYYPMLDDRPGRASMQRITCTKTWHAALDRLAWQAYLAGHDTIPSLAAPARATDDALRGLPPVFLDVGTLDGFLDENLAFAKALARAEVPVDLTVTPGAFHGSEILAPGAPTSARIRAARDAAYARLLGQSASHAAPPSSQA